MGGGSACGQSRREKGWYGILDQVVGSPAEICDQPQLRAGKFIVWVPDSASINQACDAAARVDDAENVEDGRKWTKQREKGALQSIETTCQGSQALGRGYLLPISI